MPLSNQATGSAMFQSKPLNIFLDEFVKVCEYLIEKVNDKIGKLTKKYYQGLTQERVELMYEISKK